MIYDVCMLATLGELSFHLIGMNSVHAEEDYERFTVLGSRFRHNLKFENFTLPFGRLRKRIVLKHVLCVQHVCVSSINES